LLHLKSDSEEKDDYVGPTGRDEAAFVHGLRETISNEFISKSEKTHEKLY
jgi:hypothetical protein